MCFRKEVYSHPHLHSEEPRHPIDKPCVLKMHRHTRHAKVSVNSISTFTLNVWYKCDGKERLLGGTQVLVGHRGR